jgi:predicted RND superfamily exporter protein
MSWNFRGFSLFFLLAVSLLAGFGLPHLRTDTSAFSLISRSDPDRDALEHVRKEFGSDQQTRLYVRDDALWSEAKLRSLRSLHQGLAELSFVDRVDDIFTHRLIRGKGGELESGVILADIPQDKEKLERIKANAANDPLITGSLLSRDGTWTALTLSLKEEKGGRGVHRQRYAALEKLIAAHRSEFQELFEIGPLRIEAEFHDGLIRDCLLLSPAVALLAAFTVFLLFRCVSSALVPLATAALTLLWTFGVMGWTGVPLTIFGALLPLLVIACSFIAGVHVVFVCRRRGERGRAPLAGERSLMKLMGAPLFITVTVMVAGLSVYTASEIEAIKAFALSATFAVFANGVALWLLFPHLLSCVQASTGDKGEPPPGKGRTDLLARLLALAVSSPASIMAFTLFLTAFALYQGSRLTVSAEPTSYFRESSPLRRQINELQGNLAGTKTFRITLSADTENAFLEPRNIERLTTIQKFLEKQGGFESSTSVADLLSLANREFHGGSPAFYLPPKKKALVSQYLLFFNRQELSEYLSHDLRQASIVVRHEMTDSELLNDYVKELKNVISTVAGGEIKTSITGENLMVNKVAALLLDAWGRSLTVLGAMVLLLVSLMFLSPSGGIATLILSLIPMVMTLGLMGASQVPLTLGTAMVFIVTMGFLLNGTIHLFSRYSDLCRITPDYSEAILTAIREEALPMGATAIGLIAGFLLLALSRFSFVTQMGLFAAAALLFALLAVSLVTPLIMSRIRLVGLYEILQMSIERGSLEKSSLFQGMSRYQIKKAILISELHEFDQGMLLVEQGSIGRSMFLILEGEAEVRLRSGNDHGERRLAVLKPGQVFGEIGYVRETKRTADVRALTQVHALRFDYERMENDLKFFPFIAAKINFNVCNILGERLAEADNALNHCDERKEEKENG